MDVIRTQKFSSRVAVKTSEMMLQQGTLLGSPTTGRWKSFPTAFGVAPNVVAAPIAGTVTWFRIRSVTVGSFALVCGGRITQQGSITGSLSGNYKAFSNAFNTAPQVTVTPMTGTVLWSQIRRAVAGSFSCAGSPTGKFYRYLAEGEAVGNKIFRYIAYGSV